jgi:Holliday junction DNA helicase RuvA
VFDFINGHVHSVGRGYVVIEANGVGYKLLASSRCLEYCQQSHTDQKALLLLCHLAVSETSQMLFGFENETERTLFLRLIQVNGIGPTTAINLLSSLPPDAMMRAILDSDIKALVKMKGVGKKTAERLIVELRDHLNDLQGSDVNSATATHGAHLNDLTRVLTELGFSQALANSSATRALEELGDGCDFQDLLRCALQS